jgi:hypothetical protein
MERPRFIEHRGRRILYLDLSRSSPRQHADGLRAAEASIRSEPGSELLLLADVTGAGLNPHTEQVVHEFLERTAGKTRARAFVGATGLKRRLIERTAGAPPRRLAFFEDLEAARDWLAGC